MANYNDLMKKAALYRAAKQASGVGSSQPNNFADRVKQAKEKAQQPNVVITPKMNDYSFGRWYDKVNKLRQDVDETEYNESYLQRAQDLAREAPDVQHYLRANADRFEDFEGALGNQQNFADYLSELEKYLKVNQIAYPNGIPDPNNGTSQAGTFGPSAADYYKYNPWASPDMAAITGGYKSDMLSGYTMTDVMAHAFDNVPGKKEDAWSYLLAYDPSVAMQKAQEMIDQYDAELNDPKYAGADYASRTAATELVNQKADWEQRLNQATYAMEGVRMGDVAVAGSASYDPEFESKSQYVPGAASDSASYEAYEYINGDTSRRTELKRRHNQWNPYTDYVVETGAFNHLDYLNETEKQLFNYYYNQDPEQAMHYIDTLKESLNEREAAALFEEYKGRKLKELSYGLEAGYDQFFTGMQSAFNFKDNYIPYTTEQLLGGMIREDLGKPNRKNTLWQTAYDVASTTANMLPSVLVGYLLGGTAGAITMGISASGGAYQEALNAGYNKGQAKLYSAMIGASEASLESLIGGIAKLSGARSISQKMLNGLLSKVDNAIGRAAIQLGANAASEGFEEYLQEIISPVLENVILNAGNDINLVSSDAIYAGILGAIASGPFSAATITVNAIRENRTANEAKPYTTEVVEQAAQMIPGSDTLKRVQRQIQSGGIDSVGNRDLAMLVEETRASEASGSPAEPVRTTAYTQTAQGSTKPFRGTNAVRVVSVEKGEIAVQTIDGKTVSLDSVKQEGTPLEVLRNITAENELDAVTINDMVRFYDFYLSGQKSTAEKANRFYNLYQIAVDIGRSGADIREVREISNDKGMETALNAAYARGQTIARGEQAAADMGMNGAEALRRYNYAQIPLFKKYYTAGRDGVSLSKAQSMYKANEKYLDEMKAAYKAGKKDAAAMLTSGKKTDTRKPGSMTWTARTARESLTGRQKASVDFIEKLAIITGMDYVIYESKADAKGNLQGAQGWYRGGKIGIDLNAGMNVQGDVERSAMLRTVSHELTHDLKYAAPAEYAKLQEFMLQHLNEWQEKTLDQLIQEKQERSSTKLSREDAIDEVIADGCEMMLRDSKAVEALAKENRTLFDRIRDWIKEFLNDLKTAFKGVEAKHSEAVFLMERYAGELQSIWDNALKTAANNSLTKINENKNQKSSDREFKTIADWQIETALYDALDHGDNVDENLIELGTMPQYLQDLLGMSGILYLYRNHVYQNMVSEERAVADNRFDKKAHYHDLGFERVFEAIQNIESPVMTIKSKTKENTPAVVMILPTIGYNDAPLYATVGFYVPKAINGSFRVRPHIALTISPREFFENGGRLGYADVVKDAIDNHRVIDFDKKKRSYLSVIAQTVNLGNITEVSLEENLSQFREEIKVFKEKNKINYSEREPVSSAEYRQMKAKGEIKQPKDAEVEKVQEYLQTSRLETRRLMGSGTVRKITKSVAVEVAREMRSRYGQNSISQEDLQEGIARIARLTSESKSAVEAYRQAEYEATAIASRMVDNAAGKTIQAKQDYDEIRKLIRRRRLVMEAADRKQLEAYGGYDFMKEHLRGRVLLSASGISIDQFYDEVLSQNYPEYFPPEITMPADQLRRIADVLDRFRGIFRNPAEGVTADITEIIAQDLLQMLYNDTAPNRSAEDDARLHEEMVKAYYENKINEVKIAWQNDVERMKLDLEKKRIEQRTARKEKEDRDKLLHIARRLSRIRVGSMWYDQARELLGNIDTIAKSMMGVTVIGDYIGNVSSESVPGVGTNDRGKKAVNLAELDAWVKKRQKEDPDFHPDKKTMDKLERLKNTQIADLNISHVRDLLNAMLNLEHEMRNSKKLINAQDKRDLAVQTADVRSHLEEGKQKIRPRLRKLMKEMKNWKFNTLDPIHFFRMLTSHYESDPMMRSAEEMLKGEGMMHDYIRKAEAALQEFHNDAGFMRSITGKSARTIEVTGKTKDGIQTVRITPDMAIAMLLHSKNWDNVRHIEGGGIRIPNHDLLVRGGVDEAYNQGAVVMHFRKSDLEAIGAKLTDKERNYAAKIRKYYNETSKNALNSVSRDLLGYDRYTVPNYYPLEVNKNKIGKQLDTVAVDNSIETPGYSKERSGSSSEILLRGATDTFNKMVKAHAKYYGLAIPVRNFSKLYGGVIWEIDDFGGDGDKRAGHNDESVAQTLRDTWGTEAAEYIEKLLGDIQNPKRPGEDIDRRANKIRSNYARAVLTANISVTLKQASAYPTAAMVTGWKALNKALLTKRTGDPALIEKYSPWLWHRSQGSIAKELGDLAKGKSKRAIWEKLEKVTDWVGWADKKVVQKLWVAAEYCVKERRPELQPGTDDFYKETAKVFEQIIVESQPENSIMLRPQILRSESTFIRMLNTFKGQAYLSFNTAFDSVNNLQAKGRQLKAAEAALKNDSTEESRAAAEKARQAMKDAQKQTARTFSALLVSQAMSSAIAIVYALMRGKTKKFEDEEGEINVWKMLGEFGKDLAANVAGIVPFGTEIYDVIMAIAFKETYYGLDLIALESVGNVLEQLITIPDRIGTVSAMLRGEAPVADTVQQMLDVTASVSKLFGFPQDNLENLLKIPTLWIMRAVMSENEAEYWYRYWTEKATAKNRKSDDYDSLFAIALDGEKEIYEEVYNSIWKMTWQTNKSFKEKTISKEEAKAKATETIQKAMKERIQESLIAGELDDDEAVQLLQEIAGCNETDAEDYVLIWKYKALSGSERNVGASTAMDYYLLAKPAGLSAERFEAACVAIGGMKNIVDPETGETVKERRDQVEEYIDGLDVTKEQKDALYLCEYAESGLADTAWHQ